MGQPHDIRLRCKVCGADLGPDHCEMNFITLAWHRLTTLRCALYIRGPEPVVEPIPLRPRTNARHARS